MLKAYTPPVRAWVIRDRDGAGYAREGNNGVWTWVPNRSQATLIDSEPEAYLKAHLYFPTLSTRVERV